jgi:hypothetical protein
LVGRFCLDLAARGAVKVVGWSLLGGKSAPEILSVSKSFLEGEKIYLS